MIYMSPVDERRQRRERERERKKRSIAIAIAREREKVREIELVKVKGRLDRRSQRATGSSKSKGMEVEVAAYGGGHGGRRRVNWTGSKFRHTGVVVYGNEYYFGGGIQHSPAGTTPYGTPMRVVDLGVTHVPQEVFEMYLQDISPRYAAETYSLLTHNCNNFSNEVAQFLVGATIPDYILNLPNEVMSSPMGAMILPMIQQLETTLRAGAVPQVPQFRPPTQAQTPQPTSTIGKSVASGSKSSTTKVNLKESGSKVKSEEQLAKFGESKKTDKTVSQLKSSVNDPIGNARNKVQEEICAEFTAIMASGTLRASEAAALATRRVMQRHGSQLTSFDLEKASEGMLMPAKPTITAAAPM